MQLVHTSKSADEENFDKMKATYDACMNEDVIKEAGTAPLLEVLRQIVELFPAANSDAITSAHSPAIRDTVLFLAKLGISALVSSGTSADDVQPGAGRCHRSSGRCP